MGTAGRKGVARMTDDDSQGWFQSLLAASVVVLIGWTALCFFVFWFMGRS